MMLRNSILGTAAALLALAAARAARPDTIHEAAAYGNVSTAEVRLAGTPRRLHAPADPGRPPPPVNPRQGPVPGAGALPVVRAAGPLHRTLPGPLHVAGLIGDRHPRRQCPGQGIAQHAETEHLRGEGVPEVFPGHGRGDHAGIIGALHGVVHRHARQAADLIERWLLDNPAPDGNGWEPYARSMRIVNWIKWYVTGNSLSKLATESLFLQSRALAQQIEYHLLANHLLANAKALYFAGLFFDHPEAATWREIGARILRDEVQEQILWDGGHFELSPMYHQIMLFRVLDCINLVEHNGWKKHELIELLKRKAVSMLGWLNAITF